MNCLHVLALSAAERGEWWPESWVGRFWILFGVGAQLVFTGRFIVQWIVSERRGKSHVPIAFWYLSLVGAAMLLLYAAVQRDVVIVLGQSVGGIVYIRNLMLLHREKTLLQTTGEAVRTDE